MSRARKQPTRLRGMNRERALAYCANLTAPEWSKLDNDHIIELWLVFRDYIDNDYKDTDTPVPAGIADVWGRCKALIDKEARP